MALNIGGDTQRLSDPKHEDVMGILSTVDRLISLYEFHLFMKFDEMAACGAKKNLVEEAKEKEKAPDVMAVIEKAKPTLKKDCMTAAQKARTKRIFELITSLDKTAPLKMNPEVHEKWIDSFCARIKLDDPKDIAERKKKFLALWNTIDPKGVGLTLEQYLETSNCLLQIPEVVEGMKQHSEIMFSSFDSNSDGFLSKEDYKAMLGAIGVSDADAEFGFCQLDRNKDEKRGLSLKEFSDAFWGYGFNPGNDHYSRHLWGKYRA